MKPLRPTRKSDDQIRQERERTAARKFARRAAHIAEKVKDAAIEAQERWQIMSAEYAKRGLQIVPKAKPKPKPQRRRRR